MSFSLCRFMGISIGGIIANVYLNVNQDLNLLGPKVLFKGNSTPADDEAGTLLTEK